MNRQLFLAELTQYLTFLSPREKEFIISVLSAKFDEVGTKGEPELLMELGTPMSIAISLKRRKEAGEALCPESFAGGTGVVIPENGPELVKPVPPPVHPGIMGVPTAEAEKRPKRPTAQEALVKELLDEEQQGVDEVENRADIILESDSKAQAAEAGPSAEQAHDGAAGEQGEYVEYAEEYSEEDGYIPGMTSEGTARIIEAPVPVKRKGLTPAGIVGASLLSIVVAAVMAAVAAVGAVLSYFGLNILMAGLSTLSTLNDALWMFAVGFGLLALGIFFLWLGIWAAVCIIHRLFCGKALAGTAFKRNIGTFTRTALILALVFLLVGVGCGAGSYFSGGYIDKAFENPAAVKVLEKLFTGPLSFVLALLGLQ